MLKVRPTTKVSTPAVSSRAPSQTRTVSSLPNAKSVTKAPALVRSTTIVSSQPVVRNLAYTQRSLATARDEDVEVEAKDFDIRNFVTQAGVSRKFQDEIIQKLTDANFDESTLEKVNDKFLRDLQIPTSERFALLKAANDFLQSINYNKKKTATVGIKEEEDTELEETEAEGSMPFRPSRTARPITYETDRPWDLRKFLELAGVEKENFDQVYEALNEDGFDDSKFVQLSNRYLKELRIPTEEIPGIIRASKKWARPLKPGKLNPGYERRSPSESATNYEHGYIRVGNDGQPWVVKISSD